MVSETSTPTTSGMFAAIGGAVCVFVYAVFRWVWLKAQSPLQRALREREREKDDMVAEFVSMGMSPYEANERAERAMQHAAEIQLARVKHALRGAVSDA